MKKRLFLLFTALTIGSANAQIARWIIPPVYDNIDLVPNTELVFTTDSLAKNSLWSMEGEKIATTEDFIHPFREGKALTTKPGTDEITGFFTSDGAFTPLSNCFVAHSYPYFSHGHLLVRSTAGTVFFFDEKGERNRQNTYTDAYPFMQGMAACFTYRMLVKQRKNVFFYFYTTPSGETIPFTYNGKPVDYLDIEFLSSLNEEGMGVAVIRHKVYLFDSSDRSLRPLFANPYEKDLRNQVYIDKHIEEVRPIQTDSVQLLTARSGKTDEVQILFDDLRAPTSIIFKDRRIDYAVADQSEPEYLTALNVEIDTICDTYGLSFDDTQILPPQFDSIGLLFRNNALVRNGGKWGMLRADKTQEFRLSMNKGNDIAFRHQKYETIIRLDLPTSISATETRLEINPASGCILDKTSRETRNTESGNFVQYACVLNIPDSLPDVITEIRYPVQITYNGMKSPVIPFAVKAWHYKYFNVDINDAETSVDQGSLSFTFDINAERNPGEDFYPTEVSIRTNALVFDMEKLSETRYKCKIYQLNEGVNNIVVQIVEKGCPPTTFPFEITYVKPSMKTEEEPEVAEQVKIRKMSRDPETPRLEI